MNISFFFSNVRRNEEDMQIYRRVDLVFAVYFTLELLLNGMANWFWPFLRLVCVCVCVYVHACMSVLAN